MIWKQRRAWLARGWNITLDIGFAVTLLGQAEGLTQRELARRARTSRPHVCRIEIGEYTPTIDSVLRLAHGLKSAICAYMLRGIQTGITAMMRPPQKLHPETNRQALLVQLNVIEYLYWAAQREEDPHLHDDVAIAMRTCVNAMNGWKQPDVVATMDYLGLYPDQVFAAMQAQRCWDGPWESMTNDELLRMLSEQVVERKIHLVHSGLKRLETLQRRKEQPRLMLVHPKKSQMEETVSA